MAKEKRTAEEFAESLNNLADSLFGDGEDSNREKWFNDHMKAAGYKPTLSWSDSDDDDDTVSEGYFGGKREKRTIQPRGRRNDNKGDWMYGKSS